MKKLVLTVGLMGSGKSTYIKNAGWEPYSISADQVLKLMSAPIYNNFGKRGPNMRLTPEAWSLVFQFLEQRMNSGEFIVVDATHLNAQDINAYRPLVERYGYKTYAIDFRQIPLKQVLAQNLLRPDYAQVPEEIILNKNQAAKNLRIPSFVEVLTPQNALEVLTPTPVDLSIYKKLHVFGDIQGAFTPLADYLAKNGGLKDDEFYLFIGDYLDRGIENGETLDWFLKNGFRKNVVCLAGNHERHLLQYVIKGVANNREFDNFTRPQLDKYDFPKPKIQAFLNRLLPYYYFTFDNKIFIASHAGISHAPENLDFISIKQYTLGMGKYTDNVDALFTAAVGEDSPIYQIHGHRNSDSLPIQATSHSYNLEGKVEFGGALRSLVFDYETRSITPIETPNTKVAQRFVQTPLVTKFDPVPNQILLEKLRQSPLVKEAAYGDISSFNFTQSAFRDRNWTEAATHARGLFINTKTSEIVIRSYDKFFNLGEFRHTELDAVTSWKFPFTVYRKENGYLGLAGYDSDSRRLILASKSSLRSPFAERFSDRFYTQVKNSNSSVERYLTKFNVSLVFEVIEPEFDPHIIEYSQPKLVLLDIVSRTPEFKRFSYETLRHQASLWGVDFKEKETVINSPEEFRTWIKAQEKTWDPSLEGYVIEAADGQMVKIKLPYYIFWKQMRAAANRIAKGHTVVPPDTDLGKRFVEYLYSKPREFIECASVIQLRQSFEKETQYISEIKSLESQKISR